MSKNFDKPYGYEMIKDLLRFMEKKPSAINAERVMKFIMENCDDR